MGSVTVEKAEQQHFDKILQFLLSDFLYEEPVKASLEVTEDDAKGVFEQVIRRDLRDHVSYVVWNPLGQIVAVRLTNIQRRPTETEPELPKNSDRPPKMRETYMFFTVLEDPKGTGSTRNGKWHRNRSGRLWTLVPSVVNTLACVNILSVSKNYARRGLAQRLITHNLEELSLAGCQGIFTGASAFKSQRLFGKNGYVPLREMRYDEWKAENGEQTFKCKPPNEKAVLSSSMEGTGESASTNHCAKDTCRSGKLTLRIGNLDDFIAANAEVKGEAVRLSSFEWCLTAEPDDGGLNVGIDCKSDAGRWHCKATYVIRLRSSKTEGEVEESRSIFDNETYGRGFSQMIDLRALRDEQFGYVENNAITLEAELTMYSCYVTDGAYGVRTRLHDVTFDFGTQHIYANKGFLGVNSAFFEAMFFGEFADKHKDTVSLKDVTAHDFQNFLIATAPLAPPLVDLPQHVLTLLRLAGQFQVDELIDRCSRALVADGQVKRAHSFVERLKAADELLMNQLRFDEWLHIFR
ncbi:acetyltransferase [Aphelenchoides avenae]|nr:acetyltransferase [Aphelenchus avenae]